MRIGFAKFFAAFAFVGAAFSLDVPSAELLTGFFKDRLNHTRDFACSFVCSVFVMDETLLCEGRDYLLENDTNIVDCASELSPLALSRRDLLTPIAIAAQTPDSVAVNKTRSKVAGIMCWKLKLFFEDKLYEAYLSGDNLFRVLRIENKSRGASDSDDVWELVEIAKGKDLPKRVSRSVEFGWGGSRTTMTSIRAVSEWSPLGVKGEP